MDRRQFLGKSALALGAAFSLTSLTSLGASAEAAAMPATSAASAASTPTCPEVSGLEKWLLETGRAQMDGDVYSVACQSVR